MEKDYSCTYVETLARVGRYTSMEDLRLPAFLSPMTSFRFLNCLRGLALGIAVVSQLAGQTAPANKRVDKAAAYYHYTLGHMYAEQAGNKGDFLNKAIENLRLALKADPDAAFISEELSDLYVQSGRLREAALDAEEAIRREKSMRTCCAKQSSSIQRSSRSSQRISTPG
jgi:tetratricopeptide (TPR) repeat protein